MSLKERISSPLEAGTSILDAHHLPPHLAPALEHASARLARKSQHITLVVARRDYQLPSVVPPRGLVTPTTPTPLSPSFRFNFGNGPMSKLKSLVLAGSYNGPTPARSMDSPRSGISSPGFAPPPDTPSPRFRWPLSPTTPLSPPPMTPGTASSTTTDTMSSIISSSGFGMRLIHTNELHPRSEKILNQTLEKTEKKFRVGSEWLSPAVRPSSCGLTNQLIHSSIIQNEVLFSSEGLTLLSLDRLFSLKSALSSYSKTKSHLRLEDAVDELRRTILATGSKVSKTAILRSYDWLSVSNSALVDLDRMYRRAYGGPEQLGGIEGFSAAFTEPAIKAISDFEESDSDSEIEEDMIGLAITKEKTPSPKPQLKLLTNFETKKQEVPIVKVEGEEEDEERTARPTDRLYFSMQPWDGSTIDQVLSAAPVNKSAFSPLTPTPILMSPASAKMGPMTPNGYDDISPITRGEWGFMMADNAFQTGRKVGVETF
ncbi:Hypothetical protein NCS54_01045200 [Fusarium falciforme]|uniref:Hypothetical protein n=1 Tax=Fusarium falciforme TaxID=195108 RepID=UPI002301C00A|nr:Hypothetical protein NCS54_01045200 [Fusarium falciforme]WAO92924.1 Hypothetical protein NCS54_01045200 [Fusarium falciforme]